LLFSLFLFFFQAEDGIRDKLVTGVQTCALPISSKLDGSIRTIHWLRASSGKLLVNSVHLPPSFSVTQSRPSSVPAHNRPARFGRSEERRVGKECRSRWSP